MSTARYARRLALAALALAALAAAFVGVLVAQAQPATPAPAPVAAWGADTATDEPAAEWVEHAPAVDPLLPALLGPAADLSPEQAATLGEAADRVCEGLAAGVPVAVMTSTLMGELGLTGDEARAFVGAASQARDC